MSDIEKLRESFLREVVDVLANIEQTALELEKYPDDVERMRQLFRDVHTLKGSAGMFNMAHAEAFLHEFEYLLDSFRSGKIPFAPHYVELILSSTDLVRNLLYDATPERFHKMQQEVEQRVKAISGGKKKVESLEQEVQQHTPSSEQHQVFTITVTCPQGDNTLFGQFLSGISSLGQAIHYSPDGVSYFGEVTDVVPGKWVIRLETHLQEQDIKDVLEFSDEAYQPSLRVGWDEQVLQQTKQVNDTSIAVIDDFADEPESESPASTPTAVADLNEAAEPATIETPEQTEASVEVEETKTDQKVNEINETTVKLHVDIIDKLMSIVSELVLNRNQLLQIVQQTESYEYQRPVQQLNKLVSTLQEAVMQTRMQPIGNAWSKLPRMIRDTAHELGKHIELVQHGAKTELDRQIIQIINEPLIHLVRNAVDHGIELPAERVKSGKSEVGTLTLNAYHEAGQIVIEISDDGGGIDAEKVKKKAIQQGLVRADEASKLTQSQIFDFIFEAGLSTKANVTKLSGRGVGLDVVKTSIDKVGGTIEIQSVKGKGSSFKIRIPLTLAIIPALIVQAKGKNFALGQLVIQELVLLNEQSIKNITNLHGSPVFRLREELLPLISLSDVLEIGTHEVSEGSYVVVVQAGDVRYGMMVDDVLNIQEIVVKPISRFVRPLNLYSGSTIVGGNDILLILDAVGLAQRAHLSGQDLRRKDAVVTQKHTEETTSLLMIRQNNTLRAIPLDLIDRLEELDAAKVEMVGEKAVVQYRGRVLELHNMPSELPESLKVVVIKNDVHQAGIVVDGFEDVVELVLELDDVETGEGVLGMTIVHGKSVEVVDVGHYMMKTVQGAQGMPGVAHRTPRIMLIEASDFMRKHVHLMLKTQKYHLFLFKTPAEAMTHVKHEVKHVDIILMGLDHLGQHPATMVRLMRETVVSQHQMALIGLTTNEQAPVKFGDLFDGYVSGFKKQELLDAIRLALSTLVQQKEA